MMDRDFEAVARLADVLRSKGVKVFKVGGLEMELHPSVESVSEPMPQQPPVPKEDADTCKCGHAHYAHQSGLCIHGCAVEKCVPEETP